MDFRASLEVVTSFKNLILPLENKEVNGKTAFEFFEEDNKISRPYGACRYACSIHCSYGCCSF